ncbi:MAG: 1,6-anhydro-N-acetylmuramyl-L-alanine amidase AmpD [Burkholderiales bacterium]
MKIAKRQSIPQRISDAPVLVLSGARFRLQQSGWVKGATRVRSPNFNRRPKGMPIELLVIHNISMPPGEYGGNDVVKLFTNRLDWESHDFYKTIRGLKVSAHFFIRRDGEVMQFVPCILRAWHAGQSSWLGRTNCNDFSIGIEIEGADTEPFTDSQYSTLASLTHLLKRGYPIVDITGHSDIAAGRKTDPGSNFDWQRFRSAI